MIHKKAYLQLGNQKFDGIREMDIKVMKVCCLPKRPDKWKIEIGWRDLGDVYAIYKLYSKGHKEFDLFYEAEEADPDHKGKTVLSILRGKVTIHTITMKQNTFDLRKEALIVVTSEHLEWNGEDPEAPVKVEFT